ncbi:carbohydrate ABC transporter permease [Mesomycoplasma lagogenitalium]|uniref:Carbohydrate ABC transporter permease n=1 Tax=Mesomycoplasma lagogenitalium TaxID=171286 RepID=A0ABY8LWH0_9BACT|nr:carbohydrate ABC transporter permease [Mesomycoplasma lagogenitalium]WGI36766.1 carbohydrate ABC transporter permease [Mesomycoplasma lagogenitalium]
MFWIRLKIQNSFSKFKFNKRVEKISSEVKQTNIIKIIFATLLKLITLFFFGTIIMFPFYIMVIFALSTKEATHSPTELNLFPNPVDWSNFHEAFKEGYWEALGWTALTTFISVVIKLFFSSTFGYAFSMKKWRHKNLAWVIFLSILILPEMALLIGQYRIINILQWTSSPIYIAFALIMPFAVSVFNGFMYRNAFESIPDRIKEASMVDGCSGVNYFFRVALPMVSSTTWTVGILTAFAAWNSYLWPTLLLSGGNSSVEVINIWLFEVGRNPIEDDPIKVLQNVKMAGTILAILPMFIIYFGFRKRIMNSISRNGSTIKG